jgi:DNA helicase-4
MTQGIYIGPLLATNSEPFPLSFGESWRHTLWWWRRPTQIQLRPGDRSTLTGPLFPKDGLPLRSIRAFTLETGRWWQRPAGATILCAQVVLRSGLFATKVLCIGVHGDVQRFMASLARILRAELASAQQEVQAFVDQFEQARAQLFLPTHYVRGSELMRFVNEQKPQRTGPVQAQLVFWSSHPLTAKMAHAKELIAAMKQIDAFLGDSESRRQQHNTEFIATQRKVEERYFASIETSALTDEQVTAALTFDDANVTVAAAGSGKTSVLVAKVGYALKSGMFKDDEILVLAYNKDAARELRQRIREQLGKQLNRRIAVEARTFHSLGLKVQLQDRRKGESRPRLINFEGKSGRRLMKEVLLDLIDKDAVFVQRLLAWAVSHRFPAPQVEPFDGATLQAHERRYEELCKNISRSYREGASSWEPAIPTLDPSRYVRSNEEARIYNWLYLRGIAFEYEQAVPSFVTEAINKGLAQDECVKVYRPDFTYPHPVLEKRSFYHEHFGLDAHGRAPHFLGERYERRAEHKRKALATVFQRENQLAGTPRFFETRSGQFTDGSLFEWLEKQLTGRGIQVPPADIQRQEQALKALGESDALMQLIGGFASLYRSSGLTVADLRSRASGLVRSDDKQRASSFLQWMEGYLTALDTRLGGDVMDYSQMVSNAVKLLSKAGGATMPYKLILVDEFQDISRLRAQLVQALLNQHPEQSILYCVGDDWQAINRFAGADVGIFKDTYAGLAESKSASPIEPRSTHQTQLNMTFRCAQGIADAARWFVMRTGRDVHIDKAVTAKNSATENVVRVVEHENSVDGRRLALEAELERIVGLHPAQDQSKKPIEVFILTRNRKDTSLPAGFSEDYFEWLIQRYAPRGLNVAWKSLHGSKGLGRDYVLMAGMDAGRKGYPRDGAEEPLMNLVLPPLKNVREEERRLFYVGLTRAKREVTLLCADARPSLFADELTQYVPAGVVLPQSSSKVVRYLCPHCRAGWLRLVKDDEMVGCMRYPFCGFTDKPERFPDLPTWKQDGAPAVGSRPGRRVQPDHFSRS